MPILRTRTPAIQVQTLPLEGPIWSLVIDNSFGVIFDHVFENGSDDSREFVLLLIGFVQFEVGIWAWVVLWNICPPLKLTKARERWKIDGWKILSIWKGLFSRFLLLVLWNNYDVSDHTPNGLMGIDGLSTFELMIDRWITTYLNRETSFLDTVLKQSLSNMTQLPALRGYSRILGPRLCWSFWGSLWARIN